MLPDDKRKALDSLMSLKKKKKKKEKEVYYPRCSDAHTTQSNAC